MTDNNKYPYLPRQPENSKVSLLKEQLQEFVVVGQEPFQEGYQLISSDTPGQANDIESSQHAESYAQFLRRAIPPIDIHNPASFAVYGSAEKYYENSFSYIYNSYPYDGSNYERVQWALSASAIDLAILQRQYPMATGSAAFSSNGWGSVSDTKGKYAKSSTPEYIKFSGGPYVGTVIDSSSSRESSLKINPSTGNTIEFWMKKDDYPAGQTKREVVVDVFTDAAAESSDSYGRMQVSLDSDLPDGAFSVTYMSGSKGMIGKLIGTSDDARAAVLDNTWHHYAFSFGVEADVLKCELYIDGLFEQDKTVPTGGFGTFGAVDSHFRGVIGALGMDFDSAGAGEGYGQFSGSLDDVRIWKQKRTAKQISDYFDRPTVGATDSESIDSVLGLYYKFNESVTGLSNTDSVVVDYSGRLNNGEFIGYRDTSRSTESAITKASSSITHNREVGDPIINGNSPLVKSRLLELKKIAKTHDKYNNSSLFHTVPQWAFDIPEGSSNLDSNFSILLQAIASKFDDIRLLIKGVSQIGLTTYLPQLYETSSDNYKSNFSSILGAPQDFTNNYDGLSQRKFSFQNLAARGWDVGELPIIDKVNTSEYFNNLGTNTHDEYATGLPKLIYSKAEIVKEQILSSVYNNLSNIYTTKGTRAAFRNLIRCFGVDEDLISPNTYINNIEKEIKNEPVYSAIKVKSLSFTGSNTGVTLHQTATTSEEKNYIEGKNDSTSFTLEGNFIFPKVTKVENTALTSSIFGTNQVSDQELFLSSPNNSGLSVKTIKSGTDREGSYFSLSSSAGLFTEIKTPYFRGVYDDTPWHLSVRLSENSGMPLSDFDNNISNTYKIEFAGYRYDLDVLTSNFELSESLTKAQYDSFMQGKKSLYAGARRTNITGSLLNISDAKVVNLTAWDDYLETEELREHAKGVQSTGRLYSFYGKRDNRGANRDRKDTLILNWQFEDSTFSSNKVSIIDASSGSASSVESLGSIVGYKYPAITSTISTGLPNIDQEHLTSVRYLPIDNMHSRSKIEIKDHEIEVFQLDSRPVTYLFTYEKSMYQVISREMIKMLAGVKEFNNLVGEPVYKYRQQYKSLEKLRDRFFSQVENDIDLDKFVEYYKWIDSSLGKMLEKLQPATSAMKLGLEDVVESHAFERSKYQHKSPVFEFKDPKIEGNILAINELLYDWEHGHAPLKETTTTGTLAAATATITCIGSSTSNYDAGTVTITDAAGLEKIYIFDDDSDGATATVDGSGRIRVQITGFNKDAYATELKTAILSAAGHNGSISITGPTGGAGALSLTQATLGSAGNVTISSTINSGLLALVGFSGGTGTTSTTHQQENNCLWWSDRAERDKEIKVSATTDPVRETLRTRMNTVVSGSTYAIRKLTRPYRLTVDRNRVLDQGSNRNSNKNRDLYKIINSGKEITLNKEDIYEFKKCDDVLDPQQEKIYTAKVNTEGTDGYLDMDSDLMMPFTFYSSSAGTDFSNFKDNLSITNLHDDHSPSLQSPFIRENVGGMPHRNVKLGTIDKERPEAFILTASNTKFTLKQHTGVKSVFTRGPNAFYNIRNIKTDINRKSLGNYDKNYEIVLTSGRNLNNRMIADTGSLVITPKTANQLLDIVDYRVPTRPRSEHIIVNRFSSPGAPETQAAYGRDKESEEYSIYNSINYRNLSVRQPLALLEKEHSKQFGIRSGSSTQASVHMTNRNYFYYTGSSGEMSRPDNTFIQHPIPQNDFGYSWIISSATNDKFDFVNKNSGLGHQHMFNSGSKKAIEFLGQGQETIIDGDHADEVYFFSISTYGTTAKERVDFLGLNLVLVEDIDANTNTLGNSDYSYTTLEGSQNYTTLRNSVSFMNPYRYRYVSKEFHNSSVFGPIAGTGASAVILNSILLNRNGPHGWPSWKQIRGYEHPITRAHRKSNTISRVFVGNSGIGESSIIKSSETPSMNKGYSWNKLGTSFEDAYHRARRLDSVGQVQKSRITKNYKEIMITNRFRPITVTIHGHEAPRGNVGDSKDFEFGRGIDPRMPEFFKIREATKKLTQTLRENSWNLDSYYYESISHPGHLSEREMQPGQINNPFIYFGHVSYKESFQNDISCFANEELVRDIKFKERVDHKSLDFLNTLIEENSNLERKLIEVNYIEKIYPREVNTYTKDARERQNFNFWSWNSNRDSRNIILSGNIVHKKSGNDNLLTATKVTAFPAFISHNKLDYKKSFYGLYDAVDVESDNDSTLDVTAYITASTWPLDSRKDFTAKPTNVNNSYFISGSAALASRDQGTRGEGILQNDFSTFAMGYNGLYGTPPFATVYNRRIPQIHGVHTYLAGEAKWEAADNTIGPFYDSYKDYAFDSIRLIAQDHSIIPEFRISQFVEDVLSGAREYPSLGNDFLSLTGAVNHTSPAEISVDGQFFKTYSNSDFLKYFSLVQEEVIDENDLTATRLTLKCKAAMKFLPYRGFYPAERSLELAEMFNRNYLDVEDLSIRYLPNGPISRDEADKYLNLRTKAARYSAEKCFTGPGILFNSIKAGTAVDYPIFATDFSQAQENTPSNYIVRKHVTFGIPSTTSVTGSLINSTTDRGLPRLSGSIHHRIEFEDLLNPVNIHRVAIYDNEAHPSASLLYGNSFWNRVIERPAVFGALNRNAMARNLGLDVNNTAENFSRQMLPYTLAMQNFAAETVNFFLKDGHLSTAISKPIKQFFQKETVNKMKVRLTNVDTVMYDRHSAFGPPVDDTGTGVNFVKYTPNSSATSDFVEITFKNPGANANFNLDSVTASGSMPVITLKDAGLGAPYEVVDYVFYSSAASFSPGGHQSDSQRYINVNGVSADNLAAAFLAAHGGTFLPTTFDVTRTGAKIRIQTNDAPGADSGTSIEYGNNALENLIAEEEAQFGGAATVGSESYTKSTVSNLHSHGYAPYVPPFLDPDSDPYVEITFTPTESRDYLAKEIISSCSFEYYNFHTVPNNATTNTNYKHAMSLSASLNLGMCVELETDNMNLVLSGDGLLSNAEDPEHINVESTQQVDANNRFSRWVIQTKWETPVLDFTNVTSSALDLSTNSVNFVTGSPWKTRYWDSYYTQSLGKTATPYLTSSTGIWHQKGAKIPSVGPASAKGYYLKVEDVPSADGQPGLAELLGFNSEDTVSRTKAIPKVNEYRRKLGALEDKKLLKEAIVAIPYVIDEESENEVRFVNFARTPGSYYVQARDNVDKIKRELDLMTISSHISTLEEYRELLRRYEVKSQTYMSDSPVNAIEYQLFMMDEYILPPQLDFLVSGTDPYMMYFFQFKASMDSSDLANVWQNLYPSSSSSTAKPRYSYPNKEFEGRITPHNDVSYVSHYLNTEKLNGRTLSPVHNTDNLFSPIGDKNKTRWLVFKVKQRGIANLEKIRQRSIDPRESNFRSPIEYLRESKNSRNPAGIPKDLPGLNDLAHSKLQFNWPYDYFSFVELVKLDAKIDLYNYIE